MGVKIHNMKAPGSDLGSMFTQVASTIFYLMGMHDVKWMRVRGSTATRVFGDIRYAEPATMEINVENLIDHFETGYPGYRDLWEEVLEPANMLEVSYATQARREEDFAFPDKLWAKIVYDFAVAYNFDCNVSRRELVQSLVPLYCARTADSAIRTRNMTTMEAEQLVQRQAEEFEWLKPYLVERWLKAKAQATEKPEDLLPVSS